jgi:hypothetical protein
MHRVASSKDIAGHPVFFGGQEILVELNMRKIATRRGILNTANLRQRQPICIETKDFEREIVSKNILA